MTTATVHVVIVNYRTPALVIECLRSLENDVRAHGKVHVTVVENASGDDSAEKIGAAIRSTEGWASWVTLLLAPCNGGFSYGNNYAIRPHLSDDSAAEYFWLLNPDTIVHPGTLETLLDFMQSHPQAGICGGGLDDAQGTPWHTAFRFPSFLGEVERGFQFSPITKLLAPWVVSRTMGSAADRTDWICGANMMVRRSVFQAVGLMDEAYFLYFEETDFCLQAHRAGWECWYLPQGRVIHISGQSTGVTGKANQHRRLPGYWFDSRRRYFVKNHGRWYAIGTDLAWIGSHLLGRFRQYVQRKPTDHPPHYLYDFIRHSSLLRCSVDGSVIRINKAN